MSAAAAKASEPSMEEILASIRRIIADDQDAPADEAASAEDDADTLDLTLEDAAGGLPDAAAGSPDAAQTVEDEPAPAAAALADLDLDEVTFERSDPALDIAVPELAPVPVAAKPVAPAPVRSMPEARPAAPEPMSDVRRSVETLISREATQSIGQAFNMLSHTVLTQNARTLEDLVQDMLKPMLKTWLDDNLPPLVERLIRAEIERVARGR